MFGIAELLGKRRKFVSMENVSPEELLFHSVGCNGCVVLVGQVRSPRMSKRCPAAETSKTPNKKQVLQKEAPAAFRMFLSQLLDTAHLNNIHGSNSYRIFITDPFLLLSSCFLD